MCTFRSLALTVNQGELPSTKVNPEDLERHCPRHYAKALTCSLTVLIRYSISIKSLVSSATRVITLSESSVHHTHQQAIAKSAFVDGLHKALSLCACLNQVSPSSTQQLLTSVFFFFRTRHYQTKQYNCLCYDC